MEERRVDLASEPGLRVYLFHLGPQGVGPSHWSPRLGGWSGHTWRAPLVLRAHTHSKVPHPESSWQQSLYLPPSLHSQD